MEREDVEKKSKSKKKVGFKISWPGSSSKDSAGPETCPDTNMSSEIAQQPLSPEVRNATDKWRRGAQTAVKKQQAKVVVAQLVETLARESISSKEFFQKHQEQQKEHQKSIATKYFSKQVSSNVLYSWASN